MLNLKIGGQIPVGITSDFSHVGEMRTTPIRKGAMDPRLREDDGLKISGILAARAVMRPRQFSLFLRPQYSGVLRLSEFLSFVLYCDRDNFANFKTVILAQAGIHAEPEKRWPNSGRILRTRGTRMTSLRNGVMDLGLPLREDDGLKVSGIFENRADWATSRGLDKFRYTDARIYGYADTQLRALA